MILLDNINKNNKSFENIKHIDENGIEFWYARELQPLLGYSRWENFELVIKKAIIACENAGGNVEDHFRDTTKMIRLAKNAERGVKEYVLTRYACYLIA